MNILDLLVGKPLATSEERAEEVGPLQGIPIFGLDALSSAAYGPEAALTLLIPLGLLGLNYIIPVSAAIIALLVIVYFSYLQTIAAYPGGGGSYTVARFNLGARPSLLAAAALLTDYILTAAVGISAGVGALISAVPSLQPHTLSFCLGILLMVTIVNLRGLREAGVAFMVPTYLFVGTILIVIGAGLIAVWRSGGHPVPLTPLPPPSPASEAVSYWLLLKVFATGCTALTGVEAVSNGVKAFREPAVKNAQRTLTVIIFILAVLLAGISHLVKAYGIVATVPGRPGYQSILSMLTVAVFGKGIFYYLTITSILLVLSLSANTAFADFPRLCRAIAQNNYLPHVFRFRGRRLVYSYGIVTLALLTALLLIFFDGVTDKLIPLYAVGAFLAFTLSQAGMVVHWYRKRGRHWQKSALVNGIGAFVTGITVCVVLVAKFAEGAWITLLFIPLLIVFFGFVRRHYHAARMRPARRASHRRCRHRSLEQHYQTRARICRQNQQRNHRHPRGARQTFRATEAGVAALRRDAVPRSRPSASQALDPAFAVPVRHRTDSSVHPRTVRVASTAPHRCGDSGTRRRPLVRIFSSQPARPLARMDAPGPRQ